MRISAGSLAGTISWEASCPALWAEQPKLEGNPQFQAQGVLNVTSCSENYNPDSETSEDTASKRRFLNGLYVRVWDRWLTKAKTARGGAAPEPTASANPFEDTLVLYKPSETAA